MIDHGRMVRAVRPRVAITVSYLFLFGWLLGDFTLDNYRQILTFGKLAVVPLIVLGFAVQKHLVTGFSYGLVRK